MGKPKMIGMIDNKRPNYPRSKADRWNKPFVGNRKKGKAKK